MANFLLELFARNMGNTDWVVEERKKSYQQWLEAYLEDIKQTLVRIDIRIRVGEDLPETTVEIKPDDKGRLCVWLEATPDTHLRFFHSPLSMLNWQPWEGTVFAALFKDGKFEALEEDRECNSWWLMKKLTDRKDISYGENNVYIKRAKEAYRRYLQEQGEYDPSQP